MKFPIWTRMRFKIETTTRYRKEKGKIKGHFLLTLSARPWYVFLLKALAFVRNIPASITAGGKTMIQRLKAFFTRVAFVLRNAKKYPQPVSVPAPPVRKRKPRPGKSAVKKPAKPTAKKAVKKPAPGTTPARKPRSK